MFKKNSPRIQKIWLGIALLIFLHASGGIVLSGTAESLFREGNALYENGEYVKAEANYKKILPYGIENPLVYYNLGNACFKQNKIGEAILYYEKALKLSPNDEDILDNLAYASTLAYDKIEVAEESPPTRFLKNLHYFFSLDTQLVLIIVLLYLLSLLGAYFFLRRRRGKETDFFSISISLLAFLLLLLLLSAGIKIHQAEYVYHGIVLIEKVDVLSGPGETNAILFPMHEGLKVRIREERGEWFQISLPNGLNGWVRKETIGVV
jgi:tetratricopeptide (TPR) repeat protein